MGMVAPPHSGGGVGVGSVLVPAHAVAGASASWHSVSTLRVQVALRCSSYNVTSFRDVSHARNLKTLEGDWILNKARTGGYQSKGL